MKKHLVKESSGSILSKSMSQEPRNINPIYNRKTFLNENSQVAGTGSPQPTVHVKESHLSLVALQGSNFCLNLYKAPALGFLALEEVCP